MKRTGEWETDYVNETDKILCYNKRNKRLVLDEDLCP